MNHSDGPSRREALELRVLALLTGELEATEAAELEAILAVDSELAEYRDRMAVLIGELHQARHEIEAPASGAPQCLSEDRRQAIFGNGKISETAKRREKRQVSWKTRLLEIAAIVTVLMLLAAVLIPSVGRVRSVSYTMDSIHFEAPEDVMAAPPAPMTVGRMQEQRAARPTGAPMIEGVDERRPTRTRVVEGPVNGIGGLADADGFSHQAWDFAESATSNLELGFGERESLMPSPSSAPVSRPLAVAHSAPMDPFAAPTRSSGPVDSFAPPAAQRKLGGAAPGAGPPRMAEGKFVVDRSRSRSEMFLEVAGEKSQRSVTAGSDFSYDRAPTTAYAADASIVYKPNQIVIPQVNFSGMPLGKVIETLNELAVEYDPQRTGVPIEYSPASGEGPRVNISLRNLSLDRVLQFVTQQVNHEVVQVGDVLRIQPQGNSEIERLAAAREKNVSRTPKQERETAAEPISTFSLNISDVSFRLAQAALENARVPDAARIRSEEFVNSFDYGDPPPRANEPVSLNWEIAQHPFAHDRQIVRFSLQTQAAGRTVSQPLNLALLVDNSGSMQRPDRRAILEKSLQSLAANLTDRDHLSVVLFARQSKLIAEAKNRASQQAAIDAALAYRPGGGTNLEAGLHAAYASARRHFNPQASNRVILMTDGAANLGNVDAGQLAQTVIEQRKQGIALDAYGIGWDDYNDALLEEITRNGDGRYAFLNSVESATEDFSEKLAGTLRVAAADVKVQIVWNPDRVTRYRQIGYDLHQLRPEDFRDNTVDAAEIGEAESGTALYVVQINDGPHEFGGLGTLHVRYREPATGRYHERSWPLDLPRTVPPLESAGPAVRLAATSALFAERLADNPYARGYDYADLERMMIGLPEAFPSQQRVLDLKNMIRSARNIYGNTR